MDEEEKNNSEELEEKTSEEETEKEKDKKTYSWEEMHERNEEAKGYRLGKAEEKKKRLEAEAKLKAFEDEKLTKDEKKDKRIAELEKENVDIRTGYKEKEIENLIVTIAAGKNFVGMEEVKLLAKAELASEEDPDKKTVEKVIEKIAKDKPYLISEKSAASGSGNFAKQGMEGAKDPDVMFGELIKEKL